MDIRKIRITMRASKLAGAVVYDPVVHYDGRRIVADGNIPGSLIRLMPQAWGTKRPSAWGAFVERAQDLGML